MAFLFTSGHPSDIYPADWSYIRMIGVHPAYEGCGIARTLTSHCIEYARETGEHTIALHTSELMHAARHIYEKLGFRIMQELGLRYGIMYWLYAMKL
jgi:ribosomal protein S18 acetylase RimI-like enzyme